MKCIAPWVTRVIICLAVALLVMPWPAAVSADAMQEILGKQADVEQTMKEIKDAADANNGQRSPDTTLELAIGRLETHLRSMDFRLESLPACRQAPPAPNAGEARAALRRLIMDPKETQKRGKELQERMKQRWQRRLFLDTVEDTTKRIVIAKLAASLAGIYISAIPGAGTGFDVAGVLDSAFSHMGINPLDNYRPRTFRGASQYRQYLGENGDALTRYMRQRAEETLRNHPHYRFSEQDIFFWAHNFTLQQAPRDRQAVEQQIETDRQELERIRQRGQQQSSDNSYFSGLVGRFEAAIQASRWMQDPKQFEKMKAELRVTVIDDASGQPILSPSVNAQPMPGTQRTAGNPFEYEGVGLGAYTIKAAAPGFVAATAQVEVKDCQVYPMPIRLKKRPRVTIKDIKDEDGHLVDGVQVALVNAGTGVNVGGDTYRKIALGFIVDPGAISVSATDPASLYEPASANVNAEAGQEAELHLIMRRREGLAFVVEVYDSLSGLKIDPPPGSDEPGAVLEPLDGQPAPSRQPYAGGGELRFGHMRAGSYQYRVSLCGWESQTGTFMVGSDELKGQRAVRRVTLKPRALDSFTGNVVETGTDDHIDGFKVSLIGLGPRQGYRYDTVEGRDPDPNTHTLWGAFIIKGPIYSGRYKLVITRDCYQPIVSDLWWTFCLDRGAYTPQVLRINATPEFEQARQQARALIAQINGDRQAARAAADRVQDARRKSQDLPGLAAELTNELAAFKQRHASLERECAAASDQVAEIKRLGSLAQSAANRVAVLRETAKNLAGVACELSDKAQQATVAARASNFAYNSGQFAKQTRKTADEAATLAQEQRRQLAAVGPRDFRALDQEARRLKQAYTAIAGKLQDLRARLNAARQAATSVAAANAALAEADRRLAAVKALLQPCAATHPGKGIVGQAEQARNGVAAEQARARDENALLETFFNNAQADAAAERLGRETSDTLGTCDGLNGIDAALADVKANVDTAEVFAQAAGDSARAAEECASRVQQRLISPSDSGDQAQQSPSGNASGPPTDEVPAALDSGKPDHAPGAADPTAERSRPPTDEVPGALDPVRAKGEQPINEIPGVLGSTRPQGQSPTEAVPGVLDPSGRRPPDPNPTGEQSRGKQESKPKDPNKPSKWDRVGTVLGGVLNGVGQSRNGGAGTAGGSGGTRGGSPGGGANPGGAGPGVRPCTAAESAAFARMIGTWQTVMGPKMTISGSCEQATGVEDFAEYCENPDATYNTGLKRYRANIKGRMGGDFLQIEWARPDRPDPRYQKGTGSCRVGGDGMLSCSGLPCGVNGKKK